MRGLLNLLRGDWRAFWIVADGGLVAYFNTGPLELFTNRAYREARQWMYARASMHPDRYYTLIGENRQRLMIHLEERHGYRSRPPTLRTPQ